MAQVTLNNPIANQVSLSISQAGENIGIYGRSLNTGIKANNDVISTFLGRGLKDQSNILGKILNNTSYSINTINVAQSALEGIGGILSDMLGIIAQAIPNSPNLNTLQTSLNQKLAEVVKITANTQFDGTKLLTGALSNNPTLTSKYPNNNALTSVTPGAQIGNVAFFGTAGIAAAFSTFTVGNVVATNTATIQIGGGVTSTFTAVSNGTVPGANQFAVGTTTAQTAQNLAVAISNSTDLPLQDLKVNVVNNVVTITQKTPSTINAIVTGQTGGTIAVGADTAATDGPLDLSGIKDISSFVNNPVMTCSLIGRSAVDTGGQETGIFATPYQAIKRDGTAVTIGTGANGDKAAAFRVVVGGQTFIGAVQDTAANGMNTARLKMVAANGEHFTIRFGTGYAGALDTDPNATLVANAVQGLLNATTFAQSDTLAIDTSAGDIISGGQQIGSVKGMTATFSTTGLMSKQNFKDFTITSNPAGDIIFNAVINNGTTDITYTKTVLAVNIPTLVAGSILTFSNATNSDTLSLNIGQLGLTSLGLANSYTPIATAIKKALTGGEGLQVRTGLAYTDVTTVSIPNVSGVKIFLDDAGNYQANIDLRTTVNAALATEVVTNALNKIRNEQAALQSYTESVKISAKNLESLVQVVKDASDGYLNTDLVEASAGFSQALKAMAAAIATLGAGARVAEAAQDIIRQAAQ